MKWLLAFVALIALPVLAANATRDSEPRARKAKVSAWKNNQHRSLYRKAVYRAAPRAQYARVRVSRFADMD